jgi:phosphorylcholine metabolism protein LicD
MNERNLQEYAVSYKRKIYIQNTKFTRIQKIRAGMHTNTTALKINKEADRMRIGCTVYHTDFRAQIYSVYCYYVSAVFTSTG